MGVFLIISQELPFDENITQKLNLPLLKDRRYHNRLCFFYKVVEGLVPALPSENFLTKDKRQRRKIKTTTKQDFITSNIVDRRIRNNDKCFDTKDCKTPQFKESFFNKTTEEWNALDNNIVNAPSAASFNHRILQQGLAMKN